MNTTAGKPTVDNAMSEFQVVLRETLGEVSSDAAARSMTPEEREEARFRIAEKLLGLACPEPGACSDPQCRRNALCRHLARVAAKRAAGKPSHPRRTPGAEAVRYAVWIFMSSAR